MKKLYKTALAFVLSLALVLSVSAIALADNAPAPELVANPGELIMPVAAAGILDAGALAGAPSGGIQVMLDGQYLTFTGAQPEICQGRVMAPYDGIFEAIGAKTEFNMETGAITATLGDTTVTLSIYSQAVAVKRAGVTSVIGAGILPIQKDGSVLVPLRVVMGCFGISVSWDEYANTAVLIDIPKLAADIDSHCTILNTILNASKDTAVYRQKGSGSVDLSVDDGTGGTPVHAGFTMDGITDGTAASGNMTLNLDLKSLLSDSALSSGEVDAAAQAEIQQIMDMFSNISIDYIYNPDDQTIYVKSGLLDGLLTMMGMDAAPGAWYELDLSGLLGADMTGSLLSMLGMDDTGMSSLTVGGLIALTYDYSDSYTVGDYADLQSSLPMIYALIGDQAFTTTNNADGSVTYGYSLSDKMITDLLTQSMLANQDAIDSARAEMEYQNETTDQYNALMIQYTEECGIPYDDSYALPLQTIPEDNAALVAAYIAETYQLPAFNISLSLTYKDNVMTAVNANVSMQMNSDFEKLSLTVMVSSATPGQTVITLNLTDNYDYGDGYTTGTSLKINVNYTTTVSDEPVATAPPDGAVVVDLDSLMY